jgi:hypothetical protein
MAVHVHICNTTMVHSHLHLHSNVFRIPIACCNLPSFTGTNVKFYIFWDCDPSCYDTVVWQMVINTAEEAAASIFTIQVTKVRMWVVCTGTVAKWKWEHNRSYRREQRRITLKKITLNTGPEQMNSEDGITVSLPWTAPIRGSPKPSPL